MSALPFLFLMGLDGPPGGVPDAGLYSQTPQPPRPPEPTGVPRRSPGFMRPSGGVQWDFGAALVRASRVVSQNAGVVNAVEVLMRAPIRERYEIIGLVLNQFRPGAFGRIRNLVAQDQHVTGVIEERALRTAIGQEVASTVFTVITKMAQEGDFSPTRVPVYGDLPGATLAWAGPIASLPKHFGDDGRAVAVKAGVALARAVRSVACEIVPLGLLGVRQLTWANLDPNKVCLELEKCTIKAIEVLGAYLKSTEVAAGLGADDLLSTSSGDGSEAALRTRRMQSALVLGSAAALALFIYKSRGRK